MKKLIITFTFFLILTPIFSVNASANTGSSDYGFEPFFGNLSASLSPFLSSNILSSKIYYAAGGSAYAESNTNKVTIQKAEDSRPVFANQKGTPYQSNALSNDMTRALLGMAVFFLLVGFIFIDYESRREMAF